MRMLGSSLGEAIEVRAKALEVSESPIEAAMLTGLLTARQHTESEVALSGRAIRTGTYRVFFVSVGSCTALLVPQLRVGNYRLDIAAILEVGERRVYAAIECDGHEFHSHPDDVKRDKARDRDLARDGWLVIRFPGADIARPEATGNLTWLFLERLARAWCGSGGELLMDVPGVA